jgi:hypothetical protein
MELSPVWDSAFRAVRMTVLYLVVPLLWLVKIRNFSFTDLGITTKNFLVATVLGIGVYFIALTIFLMSIGNPEFDRYFLWGNEMSAGEFAAIMALVAWMAALTDIWTRGMVMMPILKLKGIPLAILAQNVVWFAAHAYEIEFLIGSLTLAGAVTLTLALGILGDLVAIKTRNIIGLSIGHIILNLAFFGFVRAFY